MNNKLIIGGIVLVLVGLLGGYMLSPNVGGVYNNPTGGIIADVTGDLTGDVTGDLSVITTSTVTGFFINNGTDCTQISFSGSTTTPSYATSTCP